MSYVQLGQACPQCTIASGAACIPCPEGSDLPECQKCEGGVPIAVEPSFWERSKVLAPIILGVATTVATGFVLHRYFKGAE
jgi:hypothetical protein